MWLNKMDNYTWLYFYENQTQCHVLLMIAVYIAEKFTYA